MGLSFADAVSSIAYCCLTGYMVEFPRVTALRENYLMDKANGCNWKRLYMWFLLTLWGRFFLNSQQTFQILKKSSTLYRSRRFIAVNTPLDPILS
jgi:hypothetical protein